MHFLFAVPSQSNNEAQHSSKLFKLKKVVDNPRNPEAKL